MKGKKIKSIPSDGYGFIRPSLRDYVPADKKFCEGKCDHEKIGNMLVCHGCKRILLKLK
jgi:hypothetical protein